MVVAFSMDGSHGSHGSYEVRGASAPAWDPMGPATLVASGLLPAMLKGGWR